MDEDSAETSDSRLTPIAERVDEEAGVSMKSHVARVSGRDKRVPRTKSTNLRSISPRSENRKKVGLLAGSGQYPIYFARGARLLNYDVVAVAIDLETNPALADEVYEIRWFGIGNLQEILDYYRERKVDEVVFTGKIHKSHLFTPVKMDDSMRRVITSQIQRDDVSLLTAIMAEFDKAGITVREPTAYLENLQVEGGVLTNRQPAEEDMVHIRYGFRVAKELAKHGIGQTVVVKDGVIVAVEAMEGTDQTIRRASTLIPGGGLVVVKVGGPNQDRRLDMPVVGMDTMNILIGANVRVLAVDADNTILLEREQVIEQANRHGISIIAL